MGKLHPKPEVSAIIPIFNNLELLPGLFMKIDSLRSPDLQVILVDDGSTDGSIDKLEAFVDGKTDVILLRTSMNRGVAAARNRALTEVRGEYVWFADSDDEWDPGIVRTMLAAAQATHADIVLCGAVLEAADGTHLKTLENYDDATRSMAEFWTGILRGQVHGYLWNKLFRFDLLDRELFTELTSQSDFTGVVRAASRAHKIATVRQQLYRHKVRQGSITRAANPNLGNLEECVKLLEEMLLNNGFVAEHRELFEFFTVWFYALPCAETPARLASSPASVAEGAIRAQKALQSVNLKHLAKHSRRVAIKARLIKSLGRGYSQSYKFALVLRNRIR